MSGATSTALFDGSTFNESPMVLHTILKLFLYFIDILFKIQF